MADPHEQRKVKMYEDEKHHEKPTTIQNKTQAAGVHAFTNCASIASNY